MGTNCAPLVAVKFLFCHGRSLMLFPFDNDQAAVTEAFNSITRYQELSILIILILNKWLVRYITHNFSIISDLF